MELKSKSKVSEGFLKTKIKSHIPFKLQKLLYKYIKKYRLIKNKLNKSKSCYTIKDLKNFLIAAGLKKGDTVMLHSSLSRIGYVAGGANTLINAFLDIIGEGGTLAMPTFSPEQYDKKNKLYLFDVRRTPAYTGKVPETFKLMKGVRRSLNPIHSVAAYGKNAEWIVKEHEKCDNGYAMDGPFGKLYELDAKIFLIGVDQLANSSIHIVENKCKFPIRVFSKKLDAIVIDEKGNSKKIKFRKHLPHLHKIRKNNIMDRYLFEEKLMRVYPFGNTEVRVMKARDFVHCMERLLEKGITIYNQ